VIEYAANTTNGAEAHWPEWFREIRRPAELATDESPMIDTVRHAMQQIPGEPSDIWLILQCTQPLRTPARVREAITLLQDTGADSVVSVVPLPLTHSWDFQLSVAWVGLYPVHPDLATIADLPRRRQDAEQTYIRDGTVYVFRRKTLDCGNIYGRDCRPLILEPHETCELDTELQWAEVQARWEREHAR